MTRQTDRQVAVEQFMHHKLLQQLLELINSDDDSDHGSGSDGAPGSEPAQYNDSDDSMSSQSSSEESSDSSNSSTAFKDDSSSIESDSDSSNFDPVTQVLKILNSQRYLSLRTHVQDEAIFSTSYVTKLFGPYYCKKPEKFRKAVRIDPISFQKLLKAIKHHPIFQNKSHNPQSPVRYQLAVLLHRLGHYGNAESLDSLSAIFGCSTPQHRHSDPRWS
ncbi:hypothetical protein BT69DRAFT_1332217 [Atractiella rhizophila]|nr:hypothetical protein BT69DRAFT_1332217 [Atractiella rhizophila]